jgi:hypothetical protein
MLPRSRSHTLHIYSAAPTLGVHNNIFSIHQKMFYSYIGRRHKKKIVIQVFGNVFLKVFLSVERGMWLCKRRVLKKWTSVQEIENNGYSDACLEKKREKRKKIKKKIAHVL